MPTLIKEAAAATRTGPGRVKLVLLTPGKGSSGTYTPEVIQQAADDRVWRRGSQSHINHDTAAERLERPEGNLRNLVGILDEDPYVDTDGALVAETIIGSAWRDFVDDFKDHIGASIVASAEVSESKDGRIIERLIPSPFNRCDLVTIAGRGGRIAEVIEAAKVIEARSVVTETMANDVEQYLRAAIRDAHRDDEDYAWMQDYDDTSVYFEKRGKIHQQAYSLDGVNVTLTGEPVEVRRRVEYDPVKTSAVTESKNSPPVPAGSTQKKEDAPMATTQIEEAELATLRESASRAATVEAELAEARTLLAEAETARTKATAEAIVAEAFGETEAKVTRAALITAALAAEAFDADKLRADAIEAAAEIAVTNGAGTPRGLGDTIVESKTITDDDIVNAL